MQYLSHSQRLSAAVSFSATSRSVEHESPQPPRRSPETPSHELNGCSGRQEPLGDGSHTRGEKALRSSTATDWRAISPRRTTASRIGSFGPVSEWFVRRSTESGPRHTWVEPRWGFQVIRQHQVRLRTSGTPSVKRNSNDVMPNKEPQRRKRLWPSSESSPLESETS
jgi:hypothetical protein